MNDRAQKGDKKTQSIKKAINQLMDTVLSSAPGIMALALGFSLVVWGADTFLDYYVIHGGYGTFRDVLVTRSPNHHVYLLLITLACFVVFGALITLTHSKRARTEESLRAGEARFHSLIESASDGIIIIDQSNTITLWNKGAQNMFGYKRDEIIGKPVTELMPETYRLRHQAGIQRLVRTGQSKHYGKTLEFEGLKKDGRMFPLEISLFTWQTREFRSFAAITRDISERKRAEERLQKISRFSVQATGEDFFRALVRSAANALNVKIAFIAELVSTKPARARTLALWTSEGLAENIEWPLSDTPCEEVAKGKTMCFTQGIQAIFPDDPWLAEVGSESYLGIPITDDECHVIGHMGVMDAKPIQEPQQIENMLRILADRAGAELERKWAEEALRESEARYKSMYAMFRLMTDNMPDMLWAKDMDRRYLFANRAICEKLLLTCNADEPIGKDDMFFVNRARQAHPDDPAWHTFGEICVDSDSAVMSSRQPERFDEFGNVQGKFLYLDVYKAPIWDEQGEMVGTVGCGRIVTWEKQIEQDLRESELTLRTMIESSRDAIGVSKQGVHTLVNPAYLQMFGYDHEEEMIGTPISDCIVPSEHTKIVKRVKARAQGESAPTLYETRGRRKDGSEFDLDVRVSTYTLNGEVYTFVILRDITERKQRETEHVRQERLAAVGQLAAGIAHDFNNVMAVIALYSDLLQRSENLSESELKKLQTIYQQAMHAADLTQQILDFSRRSVREPRPLDLRLLLNEMLKFIERTIPEHIRVQFAFSPGDYTINADPTQLQQMVTNLTVNARDAMPRGGALYVNLSRLTWRADETPPCTEPHCISIAPGEWIKLAVTDTGTGIDPEAMPHIFEPFFTTKEVGKGTGLGLAQVYGIVQQHEGCITVESRLGEGTTFTIFLPALMAETAVKTTASLTTLPQGRGETILLVEDNQILLEATRSVLESLNYRALTAVDGQDALTVYRAQPNQIKLILADVVMPKMDGFEMVKALQQQSPPPKALLMSGFPRDTQMPPGMNQLISGWLQKPIDIDQLAQLLHEALT